MKNKNMKRFLVVILIYRQLHDVLYVQEVVTYIFSIVSYFIKWVTTSWTSSTYDVDMQIGLSVNHQRNINSIIVLKLS